MKVSGYFLAVLLASCAFHANAAPKHSEEMKVVTAGDSLTFTINLDPTPDFVGGTVKVLICQLYDYAQFLNAGAVVNNPHFSRASSTEIIPNQSRYELSVQIPGDAPAGVWHAFFSYSLPNGNHRELTHADTVFRVQARKYSKEPRYATQIAIQVTSSK